MSNTGEVDLLNMSSMNIRGLNSTKQKQKIIYLMNLKTDVKIILDSHVDETRLNQIRKMHKTMMSGYDIVSNFSLLRGLIILIRQTVATQLLI